MARKVNTMTWVVAFVAIILSVGFAACSDDDICSDDSCITADSGPKTDGIVVKPDIQTDEGASTDQFTEKDCPPKDMVFDCYEDGKADKTTAQTWTSLGEANTSTIPPTCGMEKSDVLKSKGWFVYDTVTKKATSSSYKLTCDPAK